MRRRSERKKSTDAASSPAPVVVKRSGRRSQRSSSQVAADTEKANKTEDTKPAKEIVSTIESRRRSSAEKRSDIQMRTRSSVSPQVEEKSKVAIEAELEAIQEAVEESSVENPKESSNDTNSTSVQDEETREGEQTAANVTTDIKHNNTQKTPTRSSPPLEESNDVSHADDRISEEESLNSINAEPVQQDTNDVAATNSEVNATLSENDVVDDKTRSPEKIETPIAAVVEHKKTFTRSRDRRTQSIVKSKEEPENDENAEIVNSKSQKNSSIFSTPSNEKTQNTRKRRWLSKKTSDSNSQILAISTDSLKNLISDVHPVPLCDVKLESSSEVEEVESEREEGEASPTPHKPRIEKSCIFDRERKSPKKFEQPMRKISVMNDAYESAKPVPSRNASSCILYITNLVRPFTVLQLKGLLARTGKIVENGFWIDKIKSKCYVQYETEDEAVETRHALHGVRWPTSNPKCLNVDFGSLHDMEKAMASTQESVAQFGQEMGRENRIVGTGWDRDRYEFEEKKVQGGRPVREWDVGKREELEHEAERAKEREKLRIGERGDRVSNNDRTDKDSIRNKERGERERDRKRRSSEMDRTLSASPGRKIKKKNNDPPLRLLDDLFRKTKITPCIYWLPLTPEQIAEKETRRLRLIAEHQERVRLREVEKEKERAKEREREREREKDRRRDRDRSMNHRRSNSRDRRRY